jgi:hypothetical protein
MVLGAHRTFELKCLSLAVAVCRTVRIPVQCIARTMTASSLPKVIILVIMSCTSAGCSAGGAPSFALFGAFFPAWMLCALLGVIGAASTRVVLTSRALNEAVPFQLSVCSALGVIVALLSWMVLFG